MQIIPPTPGDNQDNTLHRVEDWDNGCPPQGRAPISDLAAWPAEVVLERNMIKMMQYLKAAHAARFGSNDDKGATAVEYGLLVALIGAFLVGTITLLGGALDGLFSGVADDITNA